MQIDIKKIGNLLITVVLTTNTLKRNRVKKTLSISLYLGIRSHILA